MSAIVDLLVTRNPLLAHGPRTHASGIALPTEAAVRKPRRAHVRWDVDAPRVHIGREHRSF
jgi:hypothetical protein